MGPGRGGGGREILNEGYIKGGKWGAGVQYKPEGFVCTLCGQVLAHRVPGDPLNMAAVTPEDGQAGGHAGHVPDHDGVVHAAGGQPPVTRAPGQVQHVTVVLAQRVSTSGERKSMS